MNFYTYAVNSISSHGSAVKSCRLVKNKLLISFGMDLMINKLITNPHCIHQERTYLLSVWLLNQNLIYSTLTILVSYFLNEYFPAGYRLLLLMSTQTFSQDQLKNVHRIDLFQLMLEIWNIRHCHVRTLLWCSRLERLTKKKKGLKISNCCYEMDISIHSLKNPKLILVWEPIITNTQSMSHLTA